VHAGNVLMLQLKNAPNFTKVKVHPSTYKGRDAAMQNCPAREHRAGTYTLAHLTLAYLTLAHIL